MSKTKILIAGGGIGGLAAAIALLQRGFDVEVHEQAGELREIGAGIQISPNGNRALHSLGIFEDLRGLSCNAQAKEIRLWNSGQTWPLFDLGDQALRKYGFPYLTVFRPDLLRLLGAAVQRLKPDAIRLGARTMGVRQTAAGVTLELADAKATEKVKQYLPAIRSGILILISQRTAEELLQREGKEKLAADILAEASRPFAPDEAQSKAKAKKDADKSKKKTADKKTADEGPVRGVLFSSFIVQ